MIPTIGRVVIYNTTEEDRENMSNNTFCNVQMQVPAIIVAVWGKEENSLVNLQVICDGEKFMWKTSVSLGENEGNWNWPEIVK